MDLNPHIPKPEPPKEEEKKEEKKEDEKEKDEEKKEDAKVRSVLFYKLSDRHENTSQRQCDRSKKLTYIPFVLQENKDEDKEKDNKEDK